MPRFAANLTTLFTERPFLDRFAAAADAGFTACEILFPYDHPAEVVAERLGANGLTLALFNMPPGDWAAGERGHAALPNAAAACAAGVAEALRYAAITGTTRLHMMAGLAPAGSPAHAAAFRDALRAACAAAARQGVTVLIEPINGRDMPGYFLNGFPLAEALIAELELPNLKLQFDIYHRQILHGDVVRGLERLLPMIGHVQIAAVPGRGEPGTGELDDRLILATLDRLGYEGVVGCEYRPQTTTGAGLGWLEPWWGREL